MSEALLAIEGTPAGHQLALALALIAALLHAIFGAMQKGGQDPWLVRGAVDFFLLVLSLPVALWLVPWPSGGLWPILLGALVIHFFYKLGQAMAYERGDYTVVYPVVRGTGPLFAVLGAWLIFDEQFNPVQWLGMAVLLVGIFGLAVYNLWQARMTRAAMIPALLLAGFTGGVVAIYTTYDAWGIRQSANPFTFLVWFFVITSLDFPLIAARRWHRLSPRPALCPLLRRGFIGAFVAFGSFGSIMLATRLDKVGEAAVLRETSVVIAAMIGWLVLKERVGPHRVALMSLIALGAVIVEIAG